MADLTGTAGSVDLTLADTGNVNDAFQQLLDNDAELAARAKFPPVAASFTAAGDAYMPVHEALTLNVAGKVEAGTGTFTIAKAEAATPTSFSTITTSTSFAAGDVLKITAASVTGYCAVTIPRTA